MTVEKETVAPVTRLAVVLSHPIQYYSPWFAHLAQKMGLVLKVFYLWDFGVYKRHDPDFGVTFKWDIPLLEGYDSEFVGNISRKPGTHHFLGLNNPGLVSRVVDWRPEVVLLFGYAYFSHLQLLLSPRLRNVPIVLRGDSHDLGRQRGIRPALSQLFRELLFRRVDAFLAVGTANREYFKAAGRRPEKVFLAPHFVDNTRFRNDTREVRDQARAWRIDLGISEDVLVIGFVGKFENKKRPLDLLDAFMGLDIADHSSSRSLCSLLFVGAGQLEPELRGRVQRAGLQTVYFAPFQNQVRMPVVYRAMDLLVLPSGFGETWGLCVNEAMNAGVPAIVSDVVGCGPDLVIEGRTGWIFRSGDVEDLRRVLGLALKLTEPERMAMSDKVREHVANYSIERATQGLLEACREVI